MVQASKVSTGQIKAQAPKQPAKAQQAPANAAALIAKLAELTAKRASVATILKTNTDRLESARAQVTALTKTANNALQSTKHAYDKHGLSTKTIIIIVVVVLVVVIILAIVLGAVFSKKSGTSRLSHGGSQVSNGGSGLSDKLSTGASGSLGGKSKGGAVQIAVRRARNRAEDEHPDGLMDPTQFSMARSALTADRRSW